MPTKEVKPPRFPRFWIWFDTMLARFGFHTKNVRLRYMKNPLLKYPRNLDCYCGSGFKFKMCCIDRTSKVVPVELGGTLLMYMTEVEARNP